MSTPAPNFARFFTARRFAHKGMWLFATRASQEILMFIFTIKSLHYDTAKLMRGRAFCLSFCFYGKIKA